MTSLTHNPIPIVRGVPAACIAWISNEVANRAVVCIAIIFVGCGLYGGAIGSWRAPEMGLYVAIKFPFLILLTLLVNGLINGMLAQVLGTGMSFAQSLQSQLMSFMIFALMLGSLSPIAFGMAWNAPEHGSPEQEAAHRNLLLIHTAIIAYAGIISNYKLFRMLEVKTGNRSIAMRTLVAWLAGNLFVGAQLSWNLRPFFGSPDLDVQFIRPDPFNGTFYESVFTLLNQALNPESP